MFKNQKGFSVYRIISVVAFALLVMILSLPKFYNLDKKQKTEQCIKNMKRITSAVDQYLYDRQEDFRGDASDLVRYGYLKKSNECPEGGPGDKYIISGVYNTHEISVKCPNAVKSTPLIFDDEILDPVLFCYKVKYREDDFAKTIYDSLSEETKQLLSDYRVHNNSLLTKKQIQDWGAVIKNTRYPIDEPMKKVWASLPDSTKDIFRSYDPVEPFPEMSRIAVVEALNSIITSRTFYSEDILKDVKVNREAKNLIKDGVENLTQIQIQRVNRIILETVLPYILAESHQYNRPSDRLFENLLAEINHMIEQNLFDNQALTSQVTMSEELQLIYNEADSVILKNRTVLEAAYPRLINRNKDEFTDHSL